MKDVTFKSFVIGELYIFIILKEKLEGEQIWRIILYIFYMAGDIEAGQSYGKYLFIIDEESGDV